MRNSALYSLITSEKISFLLLTLHKSFFLILLPGGQFLWLRLSKTKLNEGTVRPNNYCFFTSLAIDGVFWRTPDTSENDAASPARHMPGTRRSTRRSKWSPDGTDQPSADGCSLRHDEEHENELTEQLIEQTGDNTLTLRIKVITHQDC